MTLTLPKARPWGTSGGGPPDVQGTFGTLQHIFTRGGAPWRYRGVSGFKLAKLFEQGQDITPFLNDYAGFNVVRTWNYVPVADWGEKAWGRSPLETWVGYIQCLADQGFCVELTLLTDDDPAQVDPARQLVEDLAPYAFENLLIEIGNEPTTHKAIDTSALRSTLEASGYCFASGDYEDSSRAFGPYLNFHSARTFDWPRRAHDAMEYYDGGGPNTPADPAHHCPCVGDEPAKLEDVSFSTKDWRAYFGTCAILGAGATFHSETGKFAERPTTQELQLAQAALEGLTAFPADAPNAGGYRRIVEPGNEPGGPTEYARTYIVGSYMVRCQQQGTQAPEAGWSPLDPEGVLFVQG